MMNEKKFEDYFPKKIFTEEKIEEHGIKMHESLTNLIRNLDNKSEVALWKNKMYQIHAQFLIKPDHYDVNLL